MIDDHKAHFINGITYFVKGKPLRITKQCLVNYCLKTSNNNLRSFIFLFHAASLLILHLIKFVFI